MKAILTGHSRGLGAAIAENLLSRNIPVLGLSRSRNVELEKRFPSVLEQHTLDLSDSLAVARWLADDVLSRFLSGCRTVLLINNAAMVHPVGAVDAQDANAIARAVGLNVATPMMLSSAVASASSHASDTRIVHISSGAGSSACPGLSVYCATKAALDHYARAAALDNTLHLRICSLAPGVVDTDMQAEIRATTPERFPLRAAFEAMKRNGELSNPAECAQRVVDYLLSERFGEVPVAAL